MVNKSSMPNKTIYKKKKLNWIDFRNKFKAEYRFVASVWELILRINLELLNHSYAVHSASPMHILHV